MHNELGNMIYSNLKSEIAQNTTLNQDIDSSLTNPLPLDAADLLLYRGEKYKEKRLKLKEEVQQKQKEECTFKPKINSKILKPSQM